MIHLYTEDTPDPEENMRILCGQENPGMAVHHSNYRGNQRAGALVCPPCLDLAPFIDLDEADL